MHRQARTGGDRGSSHLEWVAFREEDNAEVWTDASDRNCDEHLCHRRNRHANVVALVADSAALREMARDPDYGVPIGSPAGGTDSNGERGQADQNQVRD